MSSPITLSGFNNIDFSLIIDAILEQERAPMIALENSRTVQEIKRSAYGDLQSKLGTIDSARSALASAGAFDAFTASVADETVLSASAGLGAAGGTHTVQVSTLAKAQVLASSSTAAASTDTVADGGSITIGGQSYNVQGATSLLELRDRINADEQGLARASVIDTGSGFRLSLTAKQTGAASAFTVQNNLTLGGGAAALTFLDTDNDGTSGDSAADNAVVASDASLTINGIAITRATNTIQGALAGVDLTLKSEGTTTLEVSTDSATIKNKIQELVDAYNDFSGFMQQQFAVGSGPAGPLAGDFIARSASADLRAAFRGSVVTGGAYTSLAEIGIVFERTGELSIDDQALDAALAQSPEDVRKLFQVGMTTTDSRVAGVAAGSSVPGTYGVTITGLDAPATVAGSTAINGNINSDETLSFTYGTLNTNIFLPKNSSAGDIVNLLNTGLTSAGIPIVASETGGLLSLSTTATGSSETFTVVSDVNDQGNGKSTGIGTTAQNAAGTDIAGTIGGLPATGSGNRLTGDPGGAADGLAVDVSTTATGDHGTITVSGGLVSTLSSVLDRYLGSSGLLTGVEDRIDDAIGTLNQRIASMEERLVLREQELRQQFTAADQAISALNAQQDSLASLRGIGG